MKKICPKCNRSKSIKFFQNDKYRKDGKCVYCKKCRKLERAQYHKNNKNRVNEVNRNWYKRNMAQSKSAHLKAKYGIDLDFYNKMLKEQDYVCKICKTHDRNTIRGLNVDHCHKTGKIRGLLCPHCNQGLGHFRDNKNLLNKAVHYLKDSK